MSTLTSLIGGGGSGGAGVASQDFTASGSIAANVPVVVGSDGIAKEVQGSAQAEAGFQQGSFWTISYTDLPNDFVMNDANTIGITISDNINISRTMITSWFHDTSTGVWTPKSYLQLDTSSYMSSGQGALQYDATNDCFVALWVNKSDYDPRIAKLTVNPSTGAITNTGTVQIEANTGYARISLTKDDSGNIVAFVVTSNVSNTLKSWAVDASGSSVAVSDVKSLNVFTYINSVTRPFSIQYDSVTGKYFVAYKYGYDLYFYTYDRTANTAVASNQTGIYSGATTNALRPMRVGTKIVVYPSWGLAYTFEPIVADYDNATGLLSNATAGDGLSNYTSVLDHFVDSNGILHVTGQVLGGAARANPSFATVAVNSDNTLETISTYTAVSDGTNNNLFGAHTDGSKFYVVYAIGSNPYYQKAFSFTPEKSSLFGKSFVGISQGAVSDGQTVTVTTKGNIETTAATLSSFVEYYVTPTGSFTTESGGSNVYVGQAIGSNSLYVLSNLTSTSSSYKGVFVPTAGVDGYASGVSSGQTLVSIICPAGSVIKVTAVIPSTTANVRYANAYVNGLRILGDGSSSTYLMYQAVSLGSNRQWCISESMSRNNANETGHLSCIWLNEGDTFEVKAEGGTSGNIYYQYLIGEIF